MPMKAASVVPAWDPIMPPVLAATANRAPSTWRRTGLAPQLGDELDHLGDAGGTQRVAPADQPTARVDGHPAAADGGVAGDGGRPGVARLVEPERLEGVELLGAGGVVQLDDVDVGRVDARPRPRPRRPSRPGARGSRCRRCPTGSCWSGCGAPRHAGLDGEHDGRRPVGERRAHEPGERRHDGGRARAPRRGVTSLWNWALGLRAPWRRALTAAAAICSTVVPRSSIWIDGPVGVEGHEHRARRVLELSCIERRSSSGTPSSMPARVAARSPVHIFSTPTASTVPAPPRVARVARWRAEAPPAHELSTLMMPALRRPAPRRKVWPRMQPWSSSRPAVALPNTTRSTWSGSTPASARASATTWWAMSSAVRSRRFMGVMAVPTTCAVRSMGPRYRSASAGRRRPAGRPSGARTGRRVGRR